MAVLTSSRPLYFGGSFNPAHRAHLICATAAASAGGFDEVILVPTNQPVLKDSDYTLACAADRLAMLELAAADANADDSNRPRFRVNPIELNRPGPTYTIDTVTELCQQHDRTIDWLIGADQLLNLHRWYRFDELMRLTQFWVMQRPGYPIDWDQVDPAARWLRNHVVIVPQMDISATAIRQHVMAGESIDAMVSPHVREYIELHRLYIPQA